MAEELDINYLIGDGGLSVESSPRPSRSPSPDATATQPQRPRGDRGKRIRRKRSRSSAPPSASNVTNPNLVITTPLEPKQQLPSNRQPDLSNKQLKLVITNAVAAKEKQLQNQVQSLKAQQRILERQLKEEKEKLTTFSETHIAAQDRFAKEAEDLRKERDHYHRLHLQQAEHQYRTEAQLQQRAATLLRLETLATERLEGLAEERQEHQRREKKLRDADSAYEAANRACRLATAQLAHLQELYYDDCKKTAELGTGEEYINQYLALARENKVYRVFEKPSDSA